MITHGDNFRLVTGVEAEASFAAWQAMRDADDRRARSPLAGRPSSCLPRPARAGKRWTSDEDDLLESIWLTHTFPQMARRLERTTDAVQGRGYFLGFAFSAEKAWS